MLVRMLNNPHAEILERPLCRAPCRLGRSLHTHASHMCVAVAVDVEATRAAAAGEWRTCARSGPPFTVASLSLCASCCAWLLKGSLGDCRRASVASLRPAHAVETRSMRRRCRGSKDCRRQGGCAAPVRRRRSSGERAGGAWARACCRGASVHGHFDGTEVVKTSRHDGPSKRSQERPRLDDVPLWMALLTTSSGVEQNDDWRPDPPQGPPRAVGTSIVAYPHQTATLTNFRPKPTKRRPFTKRKSRP